MLQQPGYNATERLRRRVSLSFCEPDSMSHRVRVSVSSRVQWCGERGAEFVRQLCKRKSHSHGRTSTPPRKRCHRVSSGVQLTREQQEPGRRAGGTTRRDVADVLRQRQVCTPDRRRAPSCRPREAAPRGRGSPIEELTAAWGGGARVRV